LTVAGMEMRRCDTSHVPNIHYTHLPVVILYTGVYTRRALQGRVVVPVTPTHILHTEYTPRAYGQALTGRRGSDVEGLRFMPEEARARLEAETQKESVGFGA
jgi:hypothetical protein